MTKLSVVIINYNTAETTARVINDFRQAEPDLNTHFILIDNGSVPPMEWPRQDAQVTFIRNNENKGFAGAANQGLKLADSDFILLLNSDVFIKPGAISALIKYLELNPSCGVIGPQLFFPNGDFQPSCGFFPNFIREFLRFSLLGKFLPFDTVIYKTVFNAAFFTKPQTVDWISGACFVTRKDLVQKIGLLDEKFFFGVEDFDFCYRTQKAGFSVCYYPEALALHHHGFSAGGHRSIKSLRFERAGMIYFLEKHYPEKKMLRYFVIAMYAIKIAARRLIF